MLMTSSEANISATVHQATGSLDDSISKRFAAQAVATRQTVHKVKCLRGYTLPSCLQMTVLSLEGQAGNCFVSCRACVRAVPM